MNFLETPFVIGSDTSEAAAESIGYRVNRLEHIVLNAVHTAADTGLTRQEIETKTGLAGNCVRPRIWALEKRGLVVDSGVRRLTTSGRRAAVMIATMNTSNDAVLTKLDIAQHALAECKTVMEAKQISDVAEAARVYLERTNASAETVNRATEIRLLAERQMGAFLKATPKNKGGKPILYADGLHPQDEPATFVSMGLKHNDAHRAQKLADIPEPEFHERIAVAKASGGKLSTAAVLQPVRPRTSNAMPTRAMFLARGAIGELEKIQSKDPERTPAIQSVRDWCDTELGVT